MNPAKLKPLNGEVAVNSRPIQVRCDGDLAPTEMIASPTLQSLFTSIHTETIELDFYETVMGSYRLAPNNPFISDADRAAIEESGLVRPGTRVEEGSLLASVLQVQKPWPGAPNPGPGMERVKDQSLRTPLGWDGAVVVSSQLLSRENAGTEMPKNVPRRVRIMLEAQRLLQAGDLLLIPPTMKPLAPVARFADLAEGIDLLVGLALALRLKMQPKLTTECVIAKAQRRAEDVLRARATGPYSLISKQPLSGRFNCPGQPFSADNAHWLWANGLNGILGELTAINCQQRCDDKVHAPFTLHVLTSHLRSLGLNVDLDSRGNHVAFRIWPAKDKELIDRSSGEIKKPETINYRTYKPEKGGVFCEEVFGREDSELRDRRFGHIELPVEVVPYFYLLGSPSTLEKLLNIPTRQLKAMVAYEAGIISEGEGFKVVEIDQKDLPVLSRTGAGAIRWMLANLPEGKLPAGLRGWALSLVTRTILVLPPDLRPLVLLESGNFATSDLNDLYRRVINRANRLRKLRELNAPQMIIFNECRMLQRAVDSLFCNQFLKRPHSVLGSRNKPLVDLSNLISWEFLNKAFKYEDYSARARAIVNTAIAPDTALVPEMIFATLCLDSAIPVLFANPDDVSGMVALRPIAHVHPVIALPESAFVQLRFTRSADPECILFQVRSPAALADAKLLLNHPIDSDAPPSKPSPLNAKTPAELIEGIISHVLSGEPLALDTGCGLLIGGCGAVDWPDPKPYSKPPDQTREIPIPPSPSSTQR